MEWSTVAQRIRSEKEYHEQYYRQRPPPLGVDFALADSPKRRPQNLTWAYYDTIVARLHGELRSKRILSVGCGTGLVAMNLAHMGARVDAFDLSETAVAVCEERARRQGVEGVRFFVSACEAADLPPDRYDAVVGEMVLHHVDIPLAARLFHKVLRPGGVGVFAEWKQYAFLDRIRSWKPFVKLFPPGGVQGYATEYERKLSRKDFEALRAWFPHIDFQYRYCLRGKVDYFRPALGARLERLDFLLLRCCPFLLPFTDAVIIAFEKKDSLPQKGDRHLADSEPVPVLG
jgi:SAM-dependent methyltransferase